MVGSNIQGKKVALVVEYDGSRYYGFQVQRQSPTIQEELERAIRDFTGESRRVLCASRTDSGVSAEAQVASFTTTAAYDAHTFVGALNIRLPDDISVLSAHEIPYDLDVRLAAFRREYRYRILNRRTPSPLLRGKTYRIARRLDLEAMQDAAKLLVGGRNFAPFAGPLVSKERSMTRRLFQADVSRTGDLIELWFAGNSFLHQQVRRMAGALTQVGLGKLTIGEFGMLIDSAQRGAAGPTLPSHGLTLVAVHYQRGLSGNDRKLSSVASRGTDDYITENI
ncbi:MAG: tRNA pseudouridine(38-40) synthase TruA [Chloroflexi bacterium]|nr:tRNA pseudouridine(38-40) synthase TruA [Chloroflexota bacterium]